MNPTASNTVLLVDDHDDSREMYAIDLAYAGYRVREAADGLSALADAAVVLPSIVVSDMRMPGPVSAADLCRHFHARGVPVIVLTAVVPGLEQDVLQAVGCERLIMKPLLPELLRAEIGRMLAPCITPGQRSGRNLPH